jgi:hypothetical protein
VFYDTKTIHLNDGVTVVVLRNHAVRFNADDPCTGFLYTGDPKTGGRYFDLVMVPDDMPELWARVAAMPIDKRAKWLLDKHFRGFGCSDGPGWEKALD